MLAPVFHNLYRQIDDGQSNTRTSYGLVYLARLLQLMQESRHIPDGKYKLSELAARAL